MAFAQYIYTSILVSELTPESAFQTCELSSKVCRHFGITGRVFANRQQALAITEGPEEVVARYFEAIRQDPISGKIILHVQRLISSREFQTYSLWLNLGVDFSPSESVRPLTPDTLQSAWPSTLSTKMRILAEAYLDPDISAAA
jgi:hypothetical protein